MSQTARQRVGFLVDDLATWLVTGHQPTGIQRVVSELLDTASARDDLATFPVIAEPGLSGSRAPRLVTIERDSLRWNDDQGVARARAGLQLVRRAAVRLPLGPIRRVARAVYLRSALRFGGITASAEQSDVALDVLVVAGGFWGSGAADRVARISQAGVDVRVVVYDLFPITNPEWYSATARQEFRAAMEEVLPVSSRIVTMSETIADRLRETFPAVADRVRVGVPTLRAHLPAGPTAAGDSLDVAASVPAPYILALSTVEPRKNHRAIIDAWRSMKDAGEAPDASLAVVGRRGWFAEDIEAEIARDGTSLMIVRIEKATDEDIEGLYGGCHATVHASWAEGFGLPARESVARGIPTLISTGIPLDGLPQGTYESFAPDDIERLSRLFADVLSRPRTRRDTAWGAGTGWEPMIEALLGPNEPGDYAG